MLARISASKGGDLRDHAAGFRNGNGKVVRLGRASLQPGRIERVVPGRAAVELVHGCAALGIGGIQAVKGIIGVPAGRLAVAGRAAGAGGRSLKAVQPDFNAVQQLFDDRIPAQVRHRFSAFPDAVGILVNPHMPAHLDRFGQNGGGNGVGAQHLPRRRGIDPLPGASSFDIARELAYKVIDRVLPRTVLELLRSELAHVHAIFDDVAFARGQGNRRVLQDRHRDSRDISNRGIAPAGRKRSCVVFQLFYRAVHVGRAGDIALIVENPVWNCAASSVFINPRNARHAAEIHAPGAASGSAGGSNIPAMGQDRQAYSASLSTALRC